MDAIEDPGATSGERVDLVDDDDRVLGVVSRAEMRAGRLLHRCVFVAVVHPDGRLLVFEASQGWEPLCAFLGVPVPDTPYPRENSTADFQARVAAGTMSDPEAVKAVVDQARAH